MAIASSIIAAGIGAAGVLGAAKIGAGGAKKAAATQMNMYNQTRSDLAPYLSTGTSALNQIARLWGIGPSGSGIPDTAAMNSALEGFPGYAFMRDQQARLIDHSGAARGMALSGQQLKDLSRFGADYSLAQAWQPYISMLSGLSSLGENAGAQVGNAGVNLAGNAGQFQQNAGNAWGNGIAGVANQIGSVFGQPGAQSPWAPVTQQPQAPMDLGNAWNASMGGGWQTPIQPTGPLTTLNPSFG